MNRRGNGLTADSYAPLIDLAPHLADAMLAELRQAGVAAYAAPSPDPSGPAARPEPDDDDSLDRLYVDTEMKSTAEGILDTHLTRLHDVGPWTADSPEHDTLTGPRPGDKGTDTAERDDDAVWAEIVAGFDTAPADGATPWPDQENLDESPADDDGDDSTGRLPTARVIKSVGPEDEPLEPDDDGHYVPPPPPPLPSGDPVSRAAWAGLVGGPLYLLLTVILGWSVSGWGAFLSVAAFIGGFVVLVLRMGDDPRDSDDGAVI